MGSGEIRVRSVSHRETSSLTTRAGAAARAAAAGAGCGAALELGLKALEARAHQHAALGREAPRVNRAPRPLCNGALTPGQNHGNTGYTAIFPSGLAALLGHLLSCTG